MDELQPRHIELGGCGAAPLARLEEDDADGTAGETRIFECLDKLALRIREAEKDLGVAIEALIFDIDEDGSPKREIVAGSDAGEAVDDAGARFGGRVNAEVGADELIERGELTEAAHHGDCEHGNGNPLTADGETVDFEKHSPTDRAEAGDGIERGVDEGTSAVIFSEQSRDDGTEGCVGSIHFESCK